MRATIQSAVGTLLCTTLAVLMCLPASARVRRMELGELRDKAVSIFAGEVVEVTQRIGEGGKMVWTDYTIKVSETLKGDPQPEYAVVSFAGGTTGGMSVGIHGVPKLNTGQHYVFFRNSVELSPAATVGWGQGLFGFERIDSPEGSRMILLSDDGEPLQLSPDGRLMRGSPVELSNGRVIDIQMRRDDIGPRVTGMAITDASGSVVEQRTVVSRPFQVQPARTFASYDDLRLFVQGRLASIDSPVRTR